MSSLLLAYSKYVYIALLPMYIELSPMLSVVNRAFSPFQNRVDQATQTISESNSSDSSESPEPQGTQNQNDSEPDCFYRPSA